MKLFFPKCWMMGKGDPETKFQLFEGSGLDWVQLIVSLLYWVILWFKFQKSWKEFINFKKICYLLSQNFWSIWSESKFILERLLEKNQIKI